MGEYFHGWKRKFGVAILLITCVPAVGWIRSFTFCDSLEIPTRVNGVSFVTFVDSKNGVIQHVNDRRNMLPIMFISYDVDETPEVYWKVAYSWIVIPFTVLSAWLLLSPQRETEMLSTRDPSSAAIGLVRFCSN